VLEASADLRGVEVDADTPDGEQLDTGGHGAQWSEAMSVPAMARSSSWVS
jgi:hypothetical protein